MKIIIIICLLIMCAALEAVVWPISNSSTDDELSSAFGPRINNGYDFHSGIDIKTLDDDGNVTENLDVHCIMDGEFLDADTLD